MINNFARKDSPDWQLQRRNFLCASEAGSFMGLDPYKSRRKLLREKEDGIHREATALGESYMQWGRCMESTVIVWLDRYWAWQDGRGSSVTLPPLIHTGEHHFSGQPDCVTMEFSRMIPVEIKCPAHPAPDLSVPYLNPEDIPLRYLCQILSYIEILDAPFGYLCSWTMRNGITLFRVMPNKLFFHASGGLWTKMHQWLQGRINPIVRAADKEEVKRTLSMPDGVVRII
jgi:putative phage-type endonuclease